MSEQTFEGLPYSPLSLMGQRISAENYYNTKRLVSDYPETYHGGLLIIEDQSYL